MAEYERILCVKNEVFVYRIPARVSNRGYRAADWKLDEPDWTGRMRVVSLAKKCSIKLEDKVSGDLFAEAPVDEYPGVQVEQVLDSSRYFVIRIKDPSGRSASIGIGFADRGDSFDLLVALQDHFKHLKREEQEVKDATTMPSGPKLDLGFKEGQTIKININTSKGGDDDNEGAPKRSRPRGAGGLGGALLPPPPGGVKIPPPRAPATQVCPPPVTNTFNSQPQASLLPSTFSSNNTQASTTNTGSSSSSNSGSSNLDLLLGFGMAAPVQPQVQPVAPATDPWGDFASASSTNNSSSGGWIDFN